MKKTIFLLLMFACSASFAQLYSIERNIFYNYGSLTMSAADTVGSITTDDSVEVQMGVNGPWKLLTQSVNDTALITGDDKVAENTVVFKLADEDYWTHVRQVRFRIYSTGVDTATSNWVEIHNLRGALTLSITADTTSANRVDYSNSILHGN